MIDMIVIIDRFEGEMAVCEKADRTLISLPRSGLPPEAQEGDVVIIEKQTARVDQAATAARKQAAEEKLRQVMRKT
jgi:hypothetical protein